MKKYIILIIIFLSLPFSSLYPAIDISIDGSAFRSSDNNILWELYYAFPDYQLQYTKIGPKAFKAAILFDLTIYSKDSAVISEKWIVENRLDSIPSPNSLIKLIGQKNYILFPGEFRVMLTAFDQANEKSKFKSEFNLSIHQFSDNRVSISDIQLARNIEAENQKTQKWMDVFYKNSLYVVPNPFREYYDKDPLLKAYLEIYNAKKFAPKGYNIYFSIYDSYDQEIFTSSGQTIPISDGMVEIAEMPLDLVPTGKYSFKVKVAYPMDNEKDSIIISKVFFNINSKIPPEQQTFVENESFEMSEFSTMSEERVELEFSMSKYLMTSTNMEQFNNLSTLEARQRYLFSFWKGLDPNPKTRGNERYEDFKVAAAYANKFFSYANRKGWMTDRGRVLMTYGFPTQRDQIHQNSVEKSHEIWYYDEKEGGLTFAFVDIRGIGDFKLVHSTYFSEIYNPNWYKEYVPVGSNGMPVDEQSNQRQR